MGGKHRVWVPVPGGFVTVNPSDWGLTNRIVGKGGTWRYEERGMGQHYLVHSNANNVRDAYIVVAQEREIPEGVRKLDERRAKGPDNRCPYCLNYGIDAIIPWSYPRYLI